MKRLLIIGAGGFGREVLQYAMDISAAGLAQWEIAGFLDDNLNALDNYSYEYKVIGTIAGHKVSDEYVYICAIGDPKTKLTIGRRFQNEGARFINIIHPSAYIGRTCKMGTGNVLCPGTSLTADVKMGNFIALNQKSCFTHDSVIGDGCTISSYCDITGFASLGEGVFMGSHAVVCPGVSVGDYARIGAGSVVIFDLKDNMTVLGVPAKKILK